MNTFNKKSLYVALASLGALGVTDAAQAVNLNPNGLGAVLIYPYYTTRADAGGNPYNSLLSVVNSTGTAKAVKVRFLEGKNSREVLDFNLFLSKFDVWTAAIVPSTSGGAKIVTTDNSCTLPPIPKPGGQDFVNFGYTGASDDKGGTSLDRTKEGYVEIIEMATFAPASVTATKITHVNSVPPGCGSLTDTQAAADQLAPTGGLFGGLSLINVNAGTDITQDAVALDNFYTIGGTYTDAGSTTPDLTFATPPVSVVAGVNNSVYTSSWVPLTADPVSAVLMHNNIMNEFVLDTITRSGTDWVVTFPTKRFYVATGTGNATKLFQRNFNATAGACDDVTLNLYDREENSIVLLNFSPAPSLIAQLCWEANVVTFNNSNVLGSTNVSNVPSSFQNGWLQIGFPTAISGAAANVHRLINAGATSITAIGGATTTLNTVTYSGLPVVGFAAQSFLNGSVPIGTPVVNVLSNYGGNFVQKSTTSISIGLSD